MNSWKTVLAFTYPHEAHLARINLESEGIEVMIKDELTAQVNNFYSNAIGGVKLQVHENELERAYQILIEGGYVNEPTPIESKALKVLDKITSKIPFIKGLNKIARILIFVAVILIIIIAPFAFPSYPTHRDLLVKNAWCIDQFIYEGIEYEFSQQGLQIIINNCNARMRFDKHGLVDFPGNGYGNWKMKDNNLEIYNTRDTMFDGLYSMSFQGDYIVLVSNTTTIMAWNNSWR